MSKLRSKLYSHVKKELNYEQLQEESRSLGVNFVTAGVVGLFITNIAHPKLIIVGSSIWVVFLGINVNW